MNNLPAKSAPLISSDSLKAAALGGLMGQVVLAISIHHGGSLLGLVLALVFVLSGGASMTMFLMHRHLERKPRTERAPVQSWLLALGLALVLSVYFSQ